jgi:thymidine kinase
MFSGKSEELIRRLRRAQIAKQKTIIFKPQIDKRYSKNNVVSHSGLEIEAQPIKSGIEILFAYSDTKFDVIGIDEVQFFGAELIDDINILLNCGVRIIVSGLDQDFRKEPFGIVPYLMAVADKLDKLSAICQICGADATKTQRLVNGKPATLEGNVILVGGTEQYQARCNQHWEAG